MSENCIFCKIVAGQIPCHKTYEDENLLGFLTIKPHTKGHMLLIPKKHTEDIISADENIAQKLFSVGKKLAEKIKKAFNAPRVAFLLAGLEVNHLHLHLFPISSLEQINPHNAYPLSKEEAEEALKLFAD